MEEFRGKQKRKFSVLISNKTPYLKIPDGYRMRIEAKHEPKKVLVLEKNDKPVIDDDEVAICYIMKKESLIKKVEI